MKKFITSAGIEPTSPRLTVSNANHSAIRAFVLGKSFVYLKSRRTCPSVHPMNVAYGPSDRLKWNQIRTYLNLSWLSRLWWKKWCDDWMAWCIALTFKWSSSGRSSSRRNGATLKQRNTRHTADKSFHSVIDSSGQMSQMFIRFSTFRHVQSVE